MNDRQRQILTLLRTSDQTVKALAAQFNVTEMTVRRDLKALSAREGVVVARGHVLLYDTLHKSSEDGESGAAGVRQAIAATLYRHLFPTDTLFISGGRTTLAFARYLSAHCTAPVTVVTNSLAIASTLFRGNGLREGGGHCKVVLLGGEFRDDKMDLMGPVAEKNLREYHVSWLVTGCDAASEEGGFYTADLSISNLERESVKIADHVAVVTESTKFGLKALAKFADFSEIEVLATDRQIDEGLLCRLRARGLEVIQG